MVLPGFENLQGVQNADGFNPDSELAVPASVDKVFHHRTIGYDFLSIQSQYET